MRSRLQNKIIALLILVLAFRPRGIMGRAG